MTDKAEKGPNGPAMVLALIPGLGHLYRGREALGAFCAGLVGFLYFGCSQMTGEPKAIFFGLGALVHAASVWHAGRV